jgi:hypothetical protein
MASRHDREHQMSQTDGRDNHTPKDDNLRGTFVSVLLLGAFITAAWFGVFLLFINRG